LTGFLGLVLAMAVSVASAESDLCAPFEHSTVDTSLVEKMLASARDGHLYRIDSSSSQVGFCVDSPVGRIEGRFVDFAGGLSDIPATADQQVMVTVNTESLRTGMPFIESRLKSEQFFDVGNYPRMQFVSRQFHWVNSSEAVLIGDLSLHGVTREVGFHVRLIDKARGTGSRGAERIQVKATTLISRAAFGLDALSPVVSDDVSLCMSVEAVRYRAI
jgi:polyisoprenoid-binding protein YceI